MRYELRMDDGITEVDNFLPDTLSRRKKSRLRRSVCYFIFSLIIVACSSFQLLSSVYDLNETSLPRKSPVYQHMPISISFNLYILDVRNVSVSCLDMFRVVKRIHILTL